MRRTTLSLLFFFLITVSLPGYGQGGTASIEGMVVNAANGRVVPRATVILRSSEHLISKSTMADDTGHFQFTGLEAGFYRLNAQQQSFFTDPHRRTFHPVIALSDGQFVKDLVLRLLPTAVVTGQILDEHNDPMEHVQVKLLSREYHKGRLTLMLAGLGITDDRGEYRIYEVRPGHYYLLAELDPKLRKKGVEVIAAPGVMGLIDRSGRQGEGDGPEPESPITYPPLFYPATTDFPQATALAIGPGDEARASFVFVSMPSVSIRGVVINGVTGERVKNAEVSAYWTDVFGANGGSFAGVSRDNGTFEIPGIPPGAYTLRTSFTDESGAFTGEQTAEVGPHGVDNVLLAGLPDFNIQGHVIFEGENSKVPKHVSVDFSPARIAGSYRVRAEGASLEFQGTLRPSEQYTINAVNLPDDDYLKDLRSDGHSIERNHLAGTGPRQQIEIVISPAGGHIEGVVWDQKDQPVSASVLLVPDTAHRTYFDLFRKTHSNREGKFTLRGVPPGTYTLLALDGVDPDELINDPDLLKSYLDRGESLMVSEGGHYAPLLHLVSSE
jgi:protocatechuate 3,4-dioxygenase beta subunit